jgi:hypothetical protein
MKILFRENQFNERGTSVSLFDYAHYAETILGHTSYVCANVNNELTSLPKFKERFGERCILYNDRLDHIASQNGIDLVYHQVSGQTCDLRVPNVKNVYHGVFNFYNTEVTAYISDWLAKENNSISVPYIVTLPNVKVNYRDSLGIPPDAKVIVRTGAAGNFDVSDAQIAVYNVASQQPNMYFLMLNTDVFCPPLPNIIHLEATTSREELTALLNTADAFLYARSRGETFGLSIAEALHQDLPVIYYGGGYDKNHIEMLSADKDYKWNTYVDLVNILEQPSWRKPYHSYKSLVEDFTPEKVMDKFSKVFLDITL